MNKIQRVIVTAERQVIREGEASLDRLLEQLVERGFSLDRSRTELIRSGIIVGQIPSADLRVIMQVPGVLAVEGEKTKRIQ